MAHKWQNTKRLGEGTRPQNTVFRSASSSVWSLICLSRHTECPVCNRPCAQSWRQHRHQDGLSPRSCQSSGEADPSKGHWYLRSSGSNGHLGEAPTPDGEYEGRCFRGSELTPQPGKDERKRRATAMNIPEEGNGQQGDCVWFHMASLNPREQLMKKAGVAGQGSVLLGALPWGPKETQFYSKGRGATGRHTGGWPQELGC